MSILYNKLITTVDEGKLGLNTGLNMDLPRMIEFVPNLQKEAIYVLGGETASGKSAFAFDKFLYTPFEDFIDNFTDEIKFKAFIWSLEISITSLVAKAVCRRLYMKYGILVDVNYVLSRGKNRINAEVYEKVIETKDYLDVLHDYIVIHEGENPTGIRNTVRNYLRQNGEEIHQQIPIKDPKTRQTKIINKVVGYKPNHPNMYTIMLIDHVALMRPEMGNNKKKTIDSMVNYAITMRNLYGTTSVFVQQLNRSLSSSDRFKLGTVEPQLSDFKETLK